MIGKFLSAGNCPETECRGIIDIDRSRIRRVRISGPVVINKIHRLNLILGFEKLLKDRLDIRFNVLADDHFTHLNLSVKVVMRHFKIAQGAE